MKTRFHENYFCNVFVSATTTEEWDWDWENITLSRWDFFVKGEELATYMHVTDLIEIKIFLDYTNIKENVDNIIEDKKDEAVYVGDSLVLS